MGVKGQARNSGTFLPGQGGRTRGARDKHPRTGRACVNQLLERFGTDEALLEKALRAGLTARPSASFPYLKLLIESRVGQPEQAVSVVTKIVHEIHET